MKSGAKSVATGSVATESVATESVATESVATGSVATGSLSSIQGNTPISMKEGFGEPRFPDINIIVE